MKRRIKLSKAIMVGSKIRPKTINYLFDNKKSCTLGAAYEAVFGRPINADETEGESYYLKLRRFFPELNSKKFILEGVDLQEQIIIKNDELKWSREKIAKWLAKKGL